MIVERLINNRRVFAECAEEHSRKAENVLDVFEKMAANGGAVGADTQIRFGWSLLRLRAEGNDLRVTEPDFLRWKEKQWSSTIDVTLQVLSEQTALLQRIGVTGQDAYCDQVMVVVPGSLNGPNVFMRRLSDISESDSGWVAGSLEDPEALSNQELEPVVLGSLVARRPALLQAVTLPSGFIAIFSGDKLDQVLDGSGRELLS